MHRGGRIFATILAVLLLSGALLPSISLRSDLINQNHHDPQVVLLESTASGVKFEIRVPWEQLNLEPVTMDGKEYLRTTLPGWLLMDQAGAPILPFLAEKIGAPVGVDVSLTVLPGKGHTQLLSTPVLPAASRETTWEPQIDSQGAPGEQTFSFTTKEDASLYGAQAPFPVHLAQVASDGILRGQRVLGITAYPVQYHPDSQQLTIYETLTIEVTFNGNLASLSQAPSIESPAFESLFREELLNYEQARTWRTGEILMDAEAEGETEPQTSNALAAQWSPPSPGWRVKVRVNGFYKLGYSELQAANLPVASLDPATFQLFYLGNEAAIYVTGEGDGNFDPEDYLIFYGQSINSKYTADNVYWLTYGKATGKRMITHDGTPGGAETPVIYPAKHHMESNAYYRPYAPGSDDLERWLWDYVYPSSRSSWTHNFSLTAPYTGTAILKIAMLGYIDKSNNPDHHVTISLNGTQVGETWWDGLTWRNLGMNVPTGVLQAGNNTLTVYDPNDTGVGYDVVYIDWAELEFDNTFRAEADELPFTYTTAGSWKYQVDGFSSDQVVVFDVTDPDAVKRIENINVTNSTLGYMAAFQDALEDPVNYWAMASSAYRTVQAIEADTASSLNSTGNGADYILITPDEFKVPAATLVNFRDAQMRTTLVDVQDVYDEFGYGITGVTAIHDFLAYAYTNWQAPKPAFVALVGDGHYDPKNYLGYGRESFMPPFLARADPWIGETAADNRFVTIEGNDVMPDMMLGRLSVNSPDEASAYINKLLAYEQSPTPGNWQQQILTVTDNTDSAGNFAQMSDDLLACCLPDPYLATKAYYGTTHATIDEARAAIQAGINNGALIVNYIGHAYNTAWAQEDLIKTGDVPGLTNGGKLPVVLAMTCREGTYQSPDPLANNQEALGEVITRQDGKGAIASWSPTGLGVASGHDIMNRGFFDAIFKNGMRTIGQATNKGKLDLFSTGGHRELLDTYILFGDPATEMILPEPTPTPTPTATSTATATNTATNTPTSTATATSTATNTATVTATTTSTATATRTPTVTPSLTATSTSTATATATITLTPTATNTPTLTATNTATLTATSTATATSTSTTTATSTSTATATATPTPLPEKYYLFMPAIQQKFKP